MGYYVLKPPPSDGVKGFYDFMKIVGVHVQVVEWCFTPLLTVFQSYHGASLHYSYLSWVSPVLGQGSEVSCPRTLPRKKPRGSSAARTQGPWIMSQTLYHWATQDPGSTCTRGRASIKKYNFILYYRLGKTLR